MWHDRPVSRISINPDDAGYRTDCRNFDVLLDGERVQFVNTADERSGEVFCTLTDERGNPVHNDVEFIIVRRTGRVQIIKRSKKD